MIMGLLVLSAVLCSGLAAYVILGTSRKVAALVKQAEESVYSESLRSWTREKISPK